MPQDPLQKLNSLIELLQNDTITPKELEQFLVMFLDVVKKTKDTFDQITVERVKEMQRVLNSIRSENSQALSTLETKNLELLSEVRREINNKLALATKLLDEAKAIEVKDGKDADEDFIIEQVLERIPKPKEPEVLTTEDLVKQLNSLDQPWLDAKHIKNLPAPSNARFGGSRYLSFLADVKITDIQDGDVIAWSTANKRFENTAGSGGGGTWGSITGTLSNQTDLQTALNTKVTGNVAITGATKTKVTYDAKGLVTAGADATTADIADSANKRYVTDAQLTVIGNTSGINTGDQTSIVGITGTKAQFDTAVTDGNFLYVGDVTQYTDEMVDDRVAALLVAGTNITLTYNDGAGTLTIDAVGGGGGASTALDNLASVAINTSLISDTDVADDLGSAVKRWNNIFGANLGATGTRFTKTWAVDGEFTNMPTVGGTSLNSLFQPLDSDLTTIAGLTATTDNFIVSVASAWASRTPAQVKTTLSLNNVENTALSTWAGTANITTLGTIATGTWQGGVISSTYGGTGVNNGGRTLTISTNNGTLSFTSAVTLTIANTASISGTNTGDQTTISGNAGTATALQNTRTIWGQNFDGTANVTGSLTAVTDITGGASNMIITAGTGNSRTLTLRSTTAGGVATAFITGNADQSTTFGGNISGTGAWTLTGGAGNMTIVSGTGASRTMIFQTTTAGSAATTALTLGADQSATFAGTVALGTNSLTMTGSIASTGSRVTKVWTTDIESTNMPTVGGTAILTSLTAPQFTTIELGHASDTTLARVSAGQISVEGVQVATISNAVSLTSKTITSSTNILGGVTMTLGSDADGDTYYRSSNVLTRLAKGTAGQVLTMNAGATAPSWADASATSVVKSVNQTAHGFAVNDVIKFSGSSYAKAKADTAANAEVVGIVTAVADANNFTFTMSGFVSGLTALTSDTVYYLSAATAGLLTATEPSTVGHISKPVLKTTSTTTGVMNNMRGVAVTAAASSGWTLVTHGTATGANNFTISGLTGDTDKIYKVILRAVFTTADFISSCRVNADSTAIYYNNYSEFEYIGGAAAQAYGGETASGWRMGLGDNFKNHWIEMTISSLKTYKRLAHINILSEDTGTATDTKRFMNYGTYDETATELTSLRFASNGGNNFVTGTEYWVYKTAN